MYNRCMVRKNVYFREKSVTFLKTLKTLKFSDHIRRAVDEYIDRLKQKNVSASESKTKILQGGEYDV